MVVTVWEYEEYHEIINLVASKMFKKQARLRQPAGLLFLLLSAHRRNVPNQLLRGRPGLRPAASRWRRA
jgi:hypothetical protein